MKTPMQEFIQQLKQNIENQVQFRTEFEDGVVQGLEEALDLAEDMLEKERRAIVSAFAWGNITKVQYKGQHIAGEDYYNDRYNETFNTKEK